MPPDHAPQSARAQLGTLAEAEAAAKGFESFADAGAATDARAAAVLMLFGVLDARASEHDADAVSRDLDVLLLKRASTLRTNPGQIAFPGGRIDPDDAGPVAAALREAEEETGLDPTGVEVLGAWRSFRSTIRSIW